MLKFKTTQELKPNPKLLELIKNYTYKTKKRKNYKNKLILFLYFINYVSKTCSSKH